MTCASASSADTAHTCAASSPGCASCPGWRRSTAQTCRHATWRSGSSAPLDCRRLGPPVPEVAGARQRLHHRRARQAPFRAHARARAAMCAAHLGCHSDGVLELSPPGDERFVARLRIFNPDGSEAELSGNGAREAVLYLRREGWTDRDEFSIETAAGEVRPTITSPRTSRMEMGRARLRSPDFPSGGEDGRGTVTAGGREFEFQHVSIGNPQCAIRVDDGLESWTWRRSGRRSSTASCSRTAPTCRSSGSTATVASGRGSSSAGWGRRSPRGPAHRGAAVAAVLRRRRQPGDGRAGRRRARGRGRARSRRDAHRVGRARVQRRVLGRVRGRAGAAHR